MSRATAAATRINKALTKVGPQERTVWKRVITRTGGDDLIGRPGSVSYVDTKLVPQPTYQRLGRFVVGKRSHAQEVVANGGSEVANEYEMVVSPTALSLAELRNTNLNILFKDATGTLLEVFRITDYDPVALTGTDLLFLCYIVSVSRP